MTTTVADEINGRIFETMLDYASFRLGPMAARNVFEQAAISQGSTLADATDARGWAPLDVFHAVADAYRPLLGDAFLADAITWAVPVRRDFSAMSISALTEPALLYRHLDRARSFFARHVEFEVDVRDQSHAKVTLSYRDGVPRRRDSCDIGRGILISVPLLFGLPVAEIHEVACFAKGDAACAFTVHWETEPRYATFGFAAGLVVAILGALLSPHLAWVALPVLGWATGREIRMARMRRRMLAVTEDHRRVLETHERDFERRYREIKELNEKLEGRVAERTTQIHAAMEELRERNAAMRETIDQVNRMHDGVVEAGVQGILGDAVQEFAHEMRNPMSYLLANLEFLESATDATGSGGNVPLAELTEVVRDARLGVDRMRGVLAWFLDLHRDDRGPAGPYDLNEEIRNTVESYGRTWGERIRVHVDLGELPLLHVRGKQLNQVLVNLVTNASQAMPQGNLWITTRSREGRIFLEVKDDGPGILPEYLPKIFDRGVTTKSGVGSGLGLYITKAIVERHGGRISVRSKPGDGATFEVEVPERPSET